MHACSLPLHRPIHEHPMKPAVWVEPRLQQKHRPVREGALGCKEGFEWCAIVTRS
jgi:hypothetical protein